MLAKDPLWKVVQANPSAVVFPGPEGEALRDTQARAVTALREWDTKIERRGTAPTRRGSPAATATSSKPSSPTPSGCTSICSSASTSIRAR